MAKTEVEPDDVLGDGWGENFSKMTVEDYASHCYTRGRREGWQEGMSKACGMVEFAATSLFMQGNTQQAEVLREQHARMLKAKNDQAKYEKEKDKENGT